MKLRCLRRVSPMRKSTGCCLTTSQVLARRLTGLAIDAMSAQQRSKLLIVASGEDTLDLASVKVGGFGVFGFGAG